MYQNKFKRSVYSLFNVGSAVGGLLNMLVRICELLSYKIATQQMFKHIGESVYYNIKNNHLKFSQLDWMCKKSRAKRKAIQRIKSEIDIVHVIRSNMVVR